METETTSVYDTGGAVTPGYSLTNRVCITNAITVQSVNGPKVTIIKGAAGFNGSNDVDSVRGVFMTAGCSLIGFDITNGYTTVAGSYDFDRSGGGVWLTVNCTVSNCTISGNGASFSSGGAHFYNGGIMAECTLSGNKAEVGGAAVLFYGGIMNHCILNGNLAHNTYGGGANLHYGGIMNNCMVTGNAASRYAGGVRLNSGAIMNNCTVSGNEAGDDSGGILMQGGQLNNCIIWGNSAASGTDLYQTPAALIRYTCSPDGVTNGVGGCITNNPLFVDAVNSNFNLQAGSPCINAGANTYASSGIDLVGNPRIIDVTVDMGTYEFYIDTNDFDADGLPNEWEANHFGNITDGVKASVCSNGVNTILQAYIAGLDPNDPTNRFQTSVLRSPTLENVLRWNATSGRVYAVYYSTNLISGFHPLETNIPWTAGCFTDSVHNARGQMFYKLDVRLEE